MCRKAKEETNAFCCNPTNLKPSVTRMAQNRSIGATSNKESNTPSRQISEPRSPPCLCRTSSYYDEIKRKWNFSTYPSTAACHCFLYSKHKCILLKVFHLSFYVHPSQMTDSERNACRKIWESHLCQGSSRN